MALVEDVRKTDADFEKQRFADAVSLSMQPKTDSPYRRAILLAFVGCLLGFLAGAGLSLLQIYVPVKKR